MWPRCEEVLCLCGRRRRLLPLRWLQWSGGSQAVLVSRSLWGGMYIKSEIEAWSMAWSQGVGVEVPLKTLFNAAGLARGKKQAHAMWATLAFCLLASPYLPVSRHPFYKPHTQTHAHRCLVGVVPSFSAIASFLLFLPRLPVAVAPPVISDPLGVSKPHHSRQLKPKPCPPRPPHHSPLDPSFDLSHGRTLQRPPGRDAVQEKICQDCCCCCCYQWPCWGLPVSLLLLSRLHASSEL